MMGYGAVSQPIKPQVMLDKSRAGKPEQFRKQAEYLAVSSHPGHESGRLPVLGCGQHELCRRHPERQKEKGRTRNPLHQSFDALLRFRSGSAVTLPEQDSENLCGSSRPVVQVVAVSDGIRRDRHEIDGLRQRIGECPACFPSRKGEAPEYLRIARAEPRRAADAPSGVRAGTNRFQSSTTIMVVDGVTRAASGVTQR
jgi:hypothetical protein